MNKKQIFGGIAVLAIAAVAAWNVNLNAHKSDLSDVSLANVEALAIEVGSSGMWTVYIIGSHSWKCESGGSVCCPNFYSESC